jgi:ABC-2 type transport system ATP-binding protein
MQIKVSNIVKHYATVTAVDHVSFEVGHGEVVALLGPNGAGKSSIVRMLVGFTRPDGGDIVISDDEGQFSSVPKHALGYLPEDRGLFLDRPLMDNLMYLAELRGLSAQEAKTQVDFWLERFELTDRAKENLKTLSKGNQQKIQLISAVIHQPKVAILDEPFSGLDPINQEFVVSIIKELKAQGMTILLSAHQMNLVERLADKIVLMNLGKIVAQGSLAEIKSSLSDGKKLIIRFATPININALESTSDVIRYEIAPNHEFHLTIDDSMSLNKAFETFKALGDIVDIRTEQLSLHELYLEALRDHPVTYQPAQAVNPKASQPQEASA